VQGATTAGAKEAETGPKKKGEKGVTVKRAPSSRKKKKVPAGKIRGKAKENRGSCPPKLSGGREEK